VTCRLSRRRSCSQAFSRSRNFLLPLIEELSIAISLFVGLSVCLSASMSPKNRNYTYKINLFLCVLPGRGSGGFAICRTFSFVDDVTYSRNGHCGAGDTYRMEAHCHSRSPGGRANLARSLMSKLPLTSPPMGQRGVLWRACLCVCVCVCVCVRACVCVCVCLSAIISPKLHIRVRSRSSPSFCACYLLPLLCPPLTA